MKQEVTFLIVLSLIPAVSAPDHEQEDYLFGDSSDMSRDDLMIHYFHLGFEYLEILALLQTVHNITLSLSHLKRLLQKHGLKRRKYKSTDETIRQALDHELQQSGRYLGYRSMRDKLRKKHGLTVDRETVRLLLKELDPEGVANRRAHRLSRRTYHANGPNYIWHIDGWDKLVPFGIAIHGAIDGFSRRIMWLEASSTNKNPETVARFFTNCARRVGLPLLVRADRGSENVNIELIQTTLRSLEAPETNSFLYGKSTANQRIEAWWSKFRQMGMEHWLEHFKNLLFTGIIDNSLQLHVECIRYCYMPVLRPELYDIMVLWNTHNIRASRGEGLPHGKPDIMYQMPELYNTRDYSHECDMDVLNTAAEAMTRHTSDCKPEYRELFDILLQEAERTPPCTLQEAADTLIYLLDSVDHELS